MKRIVGLSLCAVLAVALTACGTLGAPGTPTAADAAFFHSLVLQSDGSVWDSGQNTYGQLGNGTTTTSPGSTYVRVSGLSGVVAIADGGVDSLALESDGTVWSWGSNAYGQLGDGTTTDSDVPVEVRGLTGVIAIASGGGFSLALESDGTVWAWGSNHFGELGDGTNTDSTVPVEVHGRANSGILSGVIAIAAGGGFSLALLSDGTVRGWGLNNQGQLATGNTQDFSSPIQNTGLVNATAIAAGIDHGMGLDSAGRVWAWGGNYNGQLGDGTTTERLTPVQVLGPNNSGFLTGAVAIAAGAYHSLAIEGDGSVLAWGSNNHGQLGDGSTTDRHAPVQVSGLTGVTTIGAGGYQSMAIESAGSYWDWGFNYYGQLGNGTTAGSSTPARVRFGF